MRKRSFFPLTLIFAVAMVLLPLSSAVAQLPMGTCVATGLETVFTDNGDYEPDTVVGVSGGGYAPDCTVVVRVTRPDGTVVTGDGSFTPGSDSVATTAEGTFGYVYRLDGILGIYIVDVLGFDDAVLASTAFHDGPTGYRCPNTTHSPGLDAYPPTGWGNKGSALRMGDGGAGSGASGSELGFSQFQNNTAGVLVNTLDAAIPDGETIAGIEVELVARVSVIGTGCTVDSSHQIGAALSWDNGTTWTPYKTAVVTSAGFLVYKLGAADDLWGRTWTESEFTNANFVVKVQYTRLGSCAAGGIALENIRAQVTSLSCTTPVVDANPVSAEFCAGTLASFTASATGTPAPTVQWEVDDGGGFAPITNGAIYSGATTGTLSIATTADLDGHRYHAVFTNSCDSVTSADATLTVNTAPAVTSNPLDRTICVGVGTTFSAAAGGSPTPTIQWQVDTGSGFQDVVDGGVYSGATTGTLTLSSTVAAMNGYDYQAVFTNTCGTATSAAGTLNLILPPTMTLPSADWTVQYSDKVVFSATLTDDVAATVPNVSGTVTFTIENGANDVTVGPVTVVSGVGTSTATQILLPVGTYVVTVDFAPSSGCAHVTQTKNLYVTSENAIVTPDGNNETAYPIGSTFTLQFTVNETNPEPHGDPPGVLPGDIDLAGLTVNLVAVGNGANNKTVVCTSSYVPADPLAYTDSKTFTCTFTGVAVDAYEVQADVTGVGVPVAVYYAGSYRDVLTVYDTDAGFVTGGGKFIYPGSEDRVNFGLVYTFTGKGKTTPRGNLLVMRHLENGDVCRAKSNGIGAPGVVGSDASFSGKGNYVCTTPEGSSYDGAGNISILGWVRDNGEPGASSTETPDLFWIRVVAPESQLLMPMGVPANAAPLIGGNIQVPHKTGSGGKK